MPELPNVVLRVALSQPCRAERGQERTFDTEAWIADRWSNLREYVPRNHGACLADPIKQTRSSCGQSCIATVGWTYNTRVHRDFDRNRSDGHAC
jgi:hypothetical protein